MTLLQTFLRSTLWQGVAGIAGIAAVAGTAYTWFNQTGEIGVASVSLMGIDAISLTAETEKREKDVEQPRLRTIEYVLLKNKGVRAVRPSDFLTPITIKPKGRKILSMLPCPSSIKLEFPAPLISLQWSNAGDAWVAENILLNAADWVCFGIGYSESFITDKQLNNFTIDARIADSKLVHYRTFDDLVSGDTDFFLHASIVLVGPQVFAFLAVQVVLFLITFIQFESAGLAEPKTMRYWGWTMVIVLFSTATAESIAFLSFAADARQTHPVVLPLIIAHIGLLLFFGIKRVRKRSAPNDHSAP